MAEKDFNAEALRILEQKFSPEWKNEAYSLVYGQIRKFTEENKLKGTDFPQDAKSGLHVLALALAKKNLVFRQAPAEKYVSDLLIRIRDEGVSAIEEIFQEITAD